MISQAAEYALRAVVCLAQHPHAALTTRQIAVETRVPEGYLAKVMQALGRAHLVSSQRGVNGGFALLRSAGQLNLLEIISAIDLSRRITACPLGLDDHRDVLCPLHRALDSAAAGVEDTLRSITVSQLITDPSGSRPLCSRVCAKEVTL